MAVRKYYNGHNISDELLAVSEKLIITAQDLCQLVVNDVEWCHGRYLHCYHDLSANELTKGKADVSADLCQAFAANNRGLLFHDVDKEKMEIGVDKTELHAPVVIMSYPQYCRYRAVLKRLETVTDKWLKNALVMAIGGFASTHRGMRVMFCREVCDYPELDDLEFRMDHLAPNLKGRPRKKKLLSKKDSNQDSDSNGYGLILPYEKHLKRLRVRQKGQPASGKGLPPPATSAIQNGQIKSKVNRKPCLERQDSEEKKSRDVLSNTSTNKVLGKPVKKEEKDEDELQTPMETGVEPVKLHGAVERGQDSEGRKVMKVEDLYDVQAVELKSLARQRAATAPLEVPVVRQRMTTSIMSPIMQRKLMGHHHHHGHTNHANSQLPHAHAHSPHQGSPQLQQASDGHSVLRAPTYSSHVNRSPGGTPPSRNHHHHQHHHHQHHRNNHHSQTHHHQQQQQQQQLYNSQPAHQRSDRSSHVSPHRRQSQLSSSHHRQQQHPSPAHSGSSRSSIPQHLKAAHDFSSPSALAFQSPDLCSPLPSEPPPAHSIRAKRPNTFSQPPPQPEAAFPHPDQVLSRIQTLHQSSYPPEPKRQRLNSPATSVPSTSSSTGGLDEPLDLSVKPVRSGQPSSSMLHNRKEGGLSRAQERKQRSVAHTSTSSSANNSSSLSSAVGQGASAALVQGHGQEQQDMSKQSDVLLQSALFGAQFTALPRPSKPAELSPSMVPLVHPAFMQAAFSPLSMYSAQLSPTALQLAAYEELVRQKALSNMAATSSPSFMMSQLPSAYSQPTKETQK
nr:hypothetical protein BaRGS_018442 [Batillaria attramentaria]